MCAAIVYTPDGHAVDAARATSQFESLSLPAGDDYYFSIFSSVK